MIGFGSIFQTERRAGTLQKCLGNEEPKTEPSGFATAAALANTCQRGLPARRDIRLTQRLDKLGSKARPIVGDGDGHRGLRPARHDLDLRIGKVDRVLDDVAEPIDHTRPPDNDGFQYAGPRRQRVRSGDHSYDDWTVAISL